MGSTTRIEMPEMKLATENKKMISRTIIFFGLSYGALQQIGG